VLCCACREVIKTVDLRNPHQWFPVARALQRRWVAPPCQPGTALLPVLSCRQVHKVRFCCSLLIWRIQFRLCHCRIIYHAGPTNSGKTYNALQAMRAAKSGVYCGPLRYASPTSASALLAWGASQLWAIDAWADGGPTATSR
jgi:ATP-dependent RNA helicase SUPV3L1/SUV3